MHEVSPGLSVPTVLSRLQSTGVSVKDDDNSVIRKRIRVLSATVLARDTGFATLYNGTLNGGGVASNGIGLARRAGGPASGNISVALPYNATVSRAFLLWATIGGPDPNIVFRGQQRTGRFIGASRDTCWNRGTNRVYRLDLTAADLSGSSSHGISGVGNVAGADGQGASLIVLYSVPNYYGSTKTVIRGGAMTVRSGARSHTFSGFTVPSKISSARLLTGFGDGQSSAESPVLLAGSAVSATSSIRAKDGQMWDDDTHAVPTSLLPGGTTSRTNTIHFQQDCLLWSYAALSYSYTQELVTKG
jgi:hypothetical protein